jgi:phage gp29-like protein
MARKSKTKITTGGSIARPNQIAPVTIRLTQPRRFGIDIADVIHAVSSFDNVDYSRRFKLYDLYLDVLMDTHLTSVIEKRMLAVLSSPIQFRRNGKVDETINEQIRSPWFRKSVRDIMWAQFWGYSLMQFYKDGEWLNYDLVNRKHACPIKKIILRNQTDLHGTLWEEFADLLFVGDPEDLGLLAKAAPWVIYKRNTTADWAQFSEIFGMPIRKYTYDSTDDGARQQAIADAEEQAGAAVYFLSDGTKLDLVESGSKTGTADLYEKLCERCNNEISKLILGNTLTTEASSTGTQALGAVHKKVEDRVAQSDRQYVLDVLNYEMTDIFVGLGVNTVGGEFFFPDTKEVDMTAKMNILVQLKNTFSLPISDDYLYEELGIEKPKDYDTLRGKQLQAEPEPAPKPSTVDDDPEELPHKKSGDIGGSTPNTPPQNKAEQKNFFARFFDFFGQALRARASEWD